MKIINNINVSHTFEGTEVEGIEFCKICGLVEDTRVHQGDDMPYYID